jgi:hypothetical protein
MKSFSVAPSCSDRATSPPRRARPLSPFHQKATRVVVPPNCDSQVLHDEPTVHCFLEKWRGDGALGGLGSEALVAAGRKRLGQHAASSQPFGVGSEPCAAVSHNEGMRVLSSVLAVLVFAAASPTAGVARTVLVIRVKSITISGTHFDASPKGFSKGDQFVGRSRLRNAARQFGKPVGAVVGSDYSVLTLTSSTTATVFGVARLPGGTLRFKGGGHLSNGPSPPIPLIGGTGRYAGARGTVVVGPGNTPLNTYRLTLP